MSGIPHIPILRGGRPYVSVERHELCDHRDGAPVAGISLANSGLIARDLGTSRAAWDAIQALAFEDALALCRRAADAFMQADLPLGETTQSPADFVRRQSATTAMPEVMCRRNMEKIAGVLHGMGDVLAGLSGDARLAGDSFAPAPAGRVLYTARGHSLGIVLPNNSPGVHALWLPALALRMPVALRPGNREPWTPYRLCQAFLAAGYPAAAFGFYPSDHAGANMLLARADRGMVFGDAASTAPWARTGRVEVHGPGLSKVLLDDRAAHGHAQHIPVIADSIALNGGRSCVNASAVWTPAHGAEIADALARRLAAVTPRRMDDPAAGLCGFADPRVAEGIEATIEQGLRVPGAEDVTARHRAGGRLVTLQGTTFLQPTIIQCASPDHPLANREFLFPYAAVVTCPVREMAAAIGNSLIVTAITDDAALERELFQCGGIRRLNIGPIPTCAIDWTQPHEGNLFEHLFQRRVFATAAA